jgi:hypothetical protein
MTRQQIRASGAALTVIGIVVVALASPAARAGIEAQFAGPEPSAGATSTVHDTTIDASFDAAGVAARFSKRTSAPS